MKLIPICIALLLSMGAMAQSVEPTRGRVVVGDKSGQTAPYLETVTWSPSSERSFTAECSIPFSWANRQVLLRIASAPAAYTLRVNEQEVATVSTGTLPQEFNLTRHLKNDAMNRLQLELHSEADTRVLESFSALSVSPTHLDAIGPSELITQPTIRVRDVVLNLRRIGEENLAEVAIVVKCDALNEKQARIYHELIDTAGRPVKQGFAELRLRMRGEDTLRFTTVLPDSMLWSPDSPTRYRLRLRTQSIGRYTEYIDLPVAFRYLEVNNNLMSINGTPFTPNTYEVRNALGRTELEQIRARGYNLLYLFPGVATEELYTLCDELGLCVVASTPYCTAQAGESRLKGGNPSNDPKWCAETLQRAQSAYYLAQRHPSVVALALAHGSANGICLYESYLGLKALTRSLHDPRPILYPTAQGEWNTDGWQF